MLNIKKMLTKILNSLTSLVVVKDYSYAYSNLTGSTSLTITAAQMNFSTPTGYTPVGVLTVDSGHVAVVLERVSGYLDNRIRNVSGSTQSGTYTMRVVYIKVGGGYSLKALFHRLTERWWRYVRREEIAHESIEAAISYIDGSDNIGYCSRRCICVGKCTNTKWVYSNRRVLYRLHLLLNEKHNSESKQLNNQYLREKLDKLFHLNSCQCTSEYRTITISGRGWSCA